MRTASGQGPKAIQTFMGHATITMTFDRYGHLMPGSRDQARARMGTGALVNAPARIAIVGPVDKPANRW
ncbi:MAG TPA: hypothetical protein VFC77_09365 [Myxococcota bacterium]|nr:hypothetical protein [Myxococcota bacterium]